jgi:hypothetical protein
LIAVDSKATWRPVAESDLDLLALARWFAGQRLTGGEHASGRHGQAACPYGATQYAGRVLRTSRVARDLLANPGLQIVMSAGITWSLTHAGPSAGCTGRGGRRFNPGVSDCRPVP